MNADDVKIYVQAQPTIFLFFLYFLYQISGNSSSRKVIFDKSINKSQFWNFWCVSRKPTEKQRKNTKFNRCLRARVCCINSHELWCMCLAGDIDNRVNSFPLHTIQKAYSQTSKQSRHEVTERKHKIENYLLIMWKEVEQCGI